jgi:type II secretory pathway pseudopilin PulG
VKPAIQAPTNAESAFTLAEVLAALVFMAIVIPVVAQGLSLASRTGTAAARRYQAALVAERVLNEAMVTTNWNSSELKGTTRQGIADYRWTLRSEPWLVDPNVYSVYLVSVSVAYDVQGREQTVSMSTLAQETSYLQQTNAAW